MQPEDAAKDVNLRPPQLFVAHYASQRTIDSPQIRQSNIRKSLESHPPVMIVSYGSQSTPNAHHFHHGAYAMAQPDSPRHQVWPECIGHSIMCFMQQLCCYCVCSMLLHCQHWSVAMHCIGTCCKKGAVLFHAFLQGHSPSLCC